MPKHKSVGGRKSVRIRKVLHKKAKPIYNSDEDIPDEDEEAFHKDEIDTHNDRLDTSDSDEGHGTEIPEARAPGKEAVYDFSDSEDEEEMESRLRKIEASVRRRQKSESSDGEEADEEEAEVGKAKAWGKKRDDFYGADVRSKVDVGVSSDDEEADARMEEKEARLLQQKLLSQVNEADFGLDMFTESTSAPDTQADAAESEAPSKLASTVLVAADVSAMSEREKVRLLKKQYPEFMNIVSDYHDNMVEYRDRLQPIIDLHRRKILPDSSGVQLMREKARLVLDYCMCAQFYLVLRVEKAPIEGHPVIRRMVQFKQLLKQFTSAEERFKPELDFVLQKIAEKKEDEIRPVSAVSKSSRSHAKAARLSAKPTSKKVKKTVRIAVPAVAATKSDKPKRSMQSLLDDNDGEQDVVEHDLPDNDMTTGEKEALEFYDMMRMRRRAGDDNEDVDAEDADGDGAGVDEMEAEEGEESDKRAITQEMQKNRGLTAKRSKAVKNPRVKNKLKYQRKKKIHKSIVPQVITEMNRYGGEVSGIRAGRIRSVALS